MGELEEFLGIAPEGVRRKGVERIRKRGLRLLEELELVVEALSLRIERGGEGLLLSGDLEDRTLLLRDRHAARLDFSVQIGNAGGHGFERCASVRLLSELVRGGVSLPARLPELLARFFELAFRVLRALLHQRKIRRGSIRSEKPTGNRADRESNKEKYSGFHQWYFFIVLTSAL
jgi:hypothetical protein